MQPRGPILKGQKADLASATLSAVVLLLDPEIHRFGLYDQGSAKYSKTVQRYALLSSETVLDTDSRSASSSPISLQEEEMQAWT